jgi:hypothetical protein
LQDLCYKISAIPVASAGQGEGGVRSFVSERKNSMPAFVKKGIVLIMSDYLLSGILSLVLLFFMFHIRVGELYYFIGNELRCFSGHSHHFCNSLAT